MSRFKITVSGTLNTWADEDKVRRDFGMFVEDVEAVHRDIEHGSVTLDSVEALPEPTPEPDVADGPTEDLTSLVKALHATVTAVHDRLDKAGL